MSRWTDGETVPLPPTRGIAMLETTWGNDKSCTQIHATLDKP
jgi:hypothetical protein